MIEFFDLVGAVLLFLGAGLCLGAAVTLIRFPDLLSKMHGITKPQVLGILLVTTGIAVSARSWPAFAVCVLIVVVQLCTAPVAGTMVSRSAYRSGLVDTDTLVVDHLAEDLSDAGFAQSRDEVPPPPPDTPDDEPVNGSADEPLGPRPTTE